jgi:hypothetical protein
VSEDEATPYKGALGALRNLADISEQIRGTYAVIPPPAGERLAKSYAVLARAADAIGPPPEPISAPTFVGAETVTAREVGKLNTQTATLVEAVHDLVGATMEFHRATHRSNQRLIRLTVAILVVALVSIALSVSLALWA